MSGRERDAEILSSPAGLPTGSSEDGSIPAAAPRQRLPRGERRAQLLEAASSVFVAKGYHGTSVDEVAETAGVSKPILYQHFSSKRELYLAVLDAHVGKLQDALQTALHSTTSNRRRVIAAVRTFFDFVDNDTLGYRLIFESDVKDDGDIDVRVRRATEGCIEVVEEIVVADADVEADEARLLAAGLVGAAQFSARYWLDAHRPVSRDVAVATTVQLAWGGLQQVPRLD